MIVPLSVTHLLKQHNSSERHFFNPLQSFNRCWCFFEKSIKPSTAPSELQSDPETQLFLLRGHFLCRKRLIKRREHKILSWLLKKSQICEGKSGEFYSILHWLHPIKKYWKEKPPAVIEDCWVRLLLLITIGVSADHSMCSPNEAYKPGVQQ